MLTLLLLAWLGSMTDVQAPPTVRIFVAPVTAVDGFTAPDHQRRVDSRADLIRNLDDDKTLTFVETREQADLVLEVLSSQEAATGARRTQTTPRLIGRGADSETKDETAPTVIVKLTAGSFEHEIRGRHPSSILWRDAANNAGSQIKKWIRDNRARLTQRATP